MSGFAEQTKANVQPHVEEPIIAVGVLQPAGVWGSIGVGQVSRIASTVMRMAANKKSGGLGRHGEFKSQMALVAVTDGKLYAFNAKAWGRQFKVQDAVGAWERSDLDVTTQKQTVSTKVVIDVKSTGDHYELEASTILQMKGHNDAFLAALDKFLKAPGSPSPQPSSPESTADDASEE